MTYATSNIFQVIKSEVRNGQTKREEGYGESVDIMYILEISRTSYVRNPAVASFPLS